MNDIVPKGSFWKSKKGVRHSIVGFCGFPERKTNLIITLSENNNNYAFTPEKFAKSFVKDG